MGIKGFTTLIRKYAKNSTYETPLSNWKGKSIAIDASMLICEMSYGAISASLQNTNISDNPLDYGIVAKETINLIKSRLNEILNEGVKIYFVLDGPPEPLKEATKELRKNQRQKAKERLEKAEDALYSKEPLLRTEDLVNEYSKACKGYHLSKDEFHDIYAELSSMSITILNSYDYSINDAEGLCAALTINNICDASFTRDSDYHTYGGNIAFTKLYRKWGKPWVTVRSLELILEESQLEFKEFRDLCILMGTDFNKNIPKIGPVRSYKLIKEHGRIKNLPVDTTILNYKNVLKIFKKSMVRINIES